QLPLHEMPEGEETTWPEPLVVTESVATAGGGGGGGGVGDSAAEPLPPPQATSVNMHVTAVQARTRPRTISLFIFVLSNSRSCPLSCSGASCPGARPFAGGDCGGACWGIAGQMSQLFGADHPLALSVVLAGDSARDPAQAKKTGCGGSRSRFVGDPPARAA